MVLIESTETLVFVCLIIVVWAFVMSLVVPYVMVSVYYFFHDRKVRKYRRMLLESMIKGWERDHGL